MQSHVLTDRQPCARPTLMQRMRSCQSNFLTMANPCIRNQDQIQRTNGSALASVSPPQPPQLSGLSPWQQHVSHHSTCTGRLFIDLGHGVQIVAPCASILLQRHWTVVRRVGEVDADVLCRYAVCRQRSMQPRSQADLPHDIATCPRHQGGGEYPPSHQLGSNVLSRHRIRCSDQELHVYLRLLARASYA